MANPRKPRAAASDLRSLAHPPRDCSQAPFWFWNGPLDADELAGQLRAMAAQGVHAAMPHPRFGMDRRDYLEAPFWKAMQAVLDQAEKAGGRILLYDEYNWPSGGAGGRVTDGHPEFYPHALDYEVREAEGTVRLAVESLAASEPESATPLAIVAAFRVPADCPLQVRDLSAAHHEATGLPARPWGRVSAGGRRLCGRLPPGRHRLLVFFVVRTSNPSPLDSGSGSFVDYMNPRATRRFIALTHGQYARRFRRHFGTTIPCIFTDEPQAMAGGPFPWTGDFRREFRRRRGYDLLRHLVALVDDRGRDGWRHRLAYWQTVAELIEERFFAPLSRWCRRHGIALTGHIFEEYVDCWPSAPHMMNWLRQFHWPGIDALGERIAPTGAKIAASVAHLESKPHFLCEALGLARGWNATPGMAKRGYNYLALMGVDTLVPHAFFQTVENPRVECPPSFFLPSPYWKYYRAVAAMTDRLCAFNRFGRHVAPAAVYYPIESLWADGTGGKGQGVRPWERRNNGNVWAQRTAAAFDAAVTALSAGEWDCDVVDAAALAKARALPGGRLRIGPESFECLILPAVRTLPLSAWKRILEFVRAGGTLASLGPLPRRDCAGQPLEGSVTAGTGSWAVGAGRVIVLDEKADLRSALGPAITPNARFPGGRDEAIHVAVRRTDQATVWLVVNDGEPPLDVVLELPAHLLPKAEPVLTALDPVTGACLPQSAGAGPGGVVTRLRLEHTQAVLLVAEAKRTLPAAAAKPAVRKSGGSAQELREWTFQLVPRQLETAWTPDATPDWVELPVWKAIGRGWRRLEGWTRPDFDDSQWKTVVTPRGGALLDDEVALFRAPLPPGAQALRLPLPVTGEYVLHVNGREREKRLGPPPSRGVLSLGRALRGAPCTLALEVGSMSGPSGLSAGVEVLCGPAALPALADWRQLGLGWYAGRALYRSEFRLARAPRGPVWLDLGRVEHFAEVWLNGELAACLIWPPYRVEVGARLKPGVNRVSLVVSNTLANRFAWDEWGTRSGRSWGAEPRPDPSGLIGPVRVICE